jgi:serine phosphatase RsbU (regulator of sigma subunit)/pSer/pThr/pTyr-binding forkhead associated (FHA) protein
MANLVTLQGPEAGRRYALDKDCTVLGRQAECAICLFGRAVSRQHAQILLREQTYFLEDLGSSNGTFLNNKRIPSRVAVPFNEGDVLTVGPHVFALRDTPGVTFATEANLVVREQVSALTLSSSFGSQDPAGKLQVVLEIAQNLARNLDLEPLLETLVEQLLRLLPQTDRAMVILCEDGNLVVRAQRARGTQDASTMPYSRTIVRRALDEGIGVLSDDVHQDVRFKSSDTVMSLNLHSVLCVPLITKEGTRLGVIQLDRFRRGTGYQVDDLHLVATVGLQMAVALENAAFHAEKLREQRLLQELAMARDIQQGFLPTDLEFPDADFDVFGRVCPARQVAGDLYDFFPVPGGKLAFLIGDVSGKGMPAALFMVAVHTLCRHLARQYASPAQTLEKLHADMAADNPSAMFVTLLLGSYEPSSGEVVLCSGGHPPPLLRRASGKVDTISLPAGRLLGVDVGQQVWQDTRLRLAPAETLVGVTDGFLEARAPDGKDMFGTARMREVVRRFEASLSLAECADFARSAIEEFTAARELQDDGTILLLRRSGSIEK